jgi:hypothetical protein
MSKFNYMNFVGGYDSFAVSKEKYTKEEAIDIAKKEMYLGNPCYLAVGEGFVRHRAGIDEDNKPRVCWWLEYREHKRSCPCWVFHLTPNKNEKFFKGYEYIELN